MDRKDFLSSIGLSAAALLVGGCLGGCEKENDQTTASSVDFTIDLSQTKYAALLNNGGSMLENGVIIAKNNVGELVAFSQYCTHEGVTVNYITDSTPYYFRCPRHGATFEQQGSGSHTSPASSGLRQYTVTQDSNNNNLYRIH